MYDFRLVMPYPLVAPQVKTKGDHFNCFLSDELVEAAHNVIASSATAEALSEI